MSESTNPTGRRYANRDDSGGCLKEKQATLCLYREVKAMLIISKTILKKTRREVYKEPDGIGATGKIVTETPEVARLV